MTPRAARYLARSARTAAARAKTPTARQRRYEARAARMNVVQDVVAGARAREETVDEKPDPRRLHVFPGVEEYVQRHEAAVEATRIKKDE